jgi:quercetin dioxygenase-like cupin family protein
MEDTEMAYFTRDARQQRHWHQSATEIYEVLEGRMQVEVDGISHQLESGDALVVLPGAIHQVISGEDQFFARVISVHCQGAEDKFLA